MEARISKVVLSTSGRDQETCSKFSEEISEDRTFGTSTESSRSKRCDRTHCPQEDLPFNEQGVCPDDHESERFSFSYFVGKMMELVDGKAGLLDGARRFGTAFSGDDVVECGKVLTKKGFAVLWQGNALQWYHR